ncbi:ATP-utilizing enzymes [Pelotomaculum thermopropionicum SI]|uniref:ATP-utilizing enzymes n=1 Tax=Pelotomaculum thermopropionicum (strain DSM 13744 / JCM 10971 / SI) TaxID=370438 RepID=A5D5P3_PELTS|nr:ATP-utilizing enzymes [Pelotomaculum thermopropionicum SI]
MKDLEQKYEHLKEIIKSYGSVLVAFSGGVDSTFVLKAAVDALKEKAVAVTITGELYPPGETEEAARLARFLGAEHIIIENRDLDNPTFASNPPDRCYHCKKNEYGEILKVARERGFNAVIDGLNADDLSDYRPGIRAGQELGVHSPLKDVGLTKEEIRALSRNFGLPTADKPSNPCLASRFPYGTQITSEGLRQVGAAEVILRKMGIPQVRVRHHGNLARIEVPEEYLQFVAERAAEVDRSLKGLGYTYVALDLLGYRAGSMNEALRLT